MLGQIRAADIADVLVAEHLADPDAFRAELVRLVSAAAPAPPTSPADPHTEEIRPPTLLGQRGGNCRPTASPCSKIRDAGPRMSGSGSSTSSVSFSS